MLERIRGRDTPEVERKERTMKWINPKEQQPRYDTDFWVFGYGDFRSWGPDHYITLFHRDKEGEYWDMVGENHGDDMDKAACQANKIIGWLPYEEIAIPELT